MNDLTANVLATVEKCSSQEKDAILLQLLNDKWNREGRKAGLVIESADKRTVGMYYPIAKPAVRSTIPPFTPDDLRELQRAIDSPDDTVTTEEAVELLHQEIVRIRSKR